MPVYLGGFSPVCGVFTITVKNDDGKISHKATYKKGPEPKPDLNKGKDLFSEMEIYICDELTHNARSDEVNTIQGLLRPGAWYDGLTGRDRGRAMCEALSLWGS
ncbi:hypothetical protein OG568_51985 (plasmid) [Streptomyces sp. NBC_01450]|uniref:hypothetical protein n=1 Tax=Streptomyces sp. NBC_01450 TaxID=2903871 RepID=UPI002E3794D2|nr:hypothetical protein [Streptomyces sp. NBC_01450]